MMKIKFLLLCILLLAMGSCTMSAQNAKHTHYKEVSYPTPNYDRNKVNDVQGVILHHTAEPTVQRSLEVLSKGPRKVGTHTASSTTTAHATSCAPPP